MIDLNRLRSIAEGYGVEVNITPHQDQASIVIEIKKGDIVASTDISIFLIQEMQQNGVPWDEITMEKLVERVKELEESNSGRADESGVCSCGQGIPVGG